MIRRALLAIALPLVAFLLACGGGAPDNPTPTPSPSTTTYPHPTEFAEPTESVGGTDAPAYFSDCDAARRAGAAPLYATDPGYRLALDRNRDGVACE